jgi:hypothetical protein
MADIVQHPANGQQPVQRPDDLPPPADEGTWVGDPELEAETKALIAMLKYEVGVDYMSIELRFQVERVEELIGERGTAPTV